MDDGCERTVRSNSLARASILWGMKRPGMDGKRVRRYKTATSCAGRMKGRVGRSAKRINRKQVKKDWPSRTQVMQ